MTHPELYARAEKLGFPRVELRKARAVMTERDWGIFCDCPPHEDHADADKALAKLEARE